MRRTPKRTIRIFLASPGDLSVERQAFRARIERLNEGFADGAGVCFQPIGWEDALSAVGPRPQSVINELVDSSDVFILALHRRWGQASPDSAYGSYTEEEFYRALERWKTNGAPAIFVLFKNVDAASQADPGRELRKVLAFRRKLEESRSVLYRMFEDEDDFEAELDKHIRAYVRGGLPKSQPGCDLILLSPDAVHRIQEAEKEARRQRKLAETANKRADAEAARSREYALMAAMQAARAALQGRVEEARECFAKVAADTTDLHILYVASQFYFRISDYSQADTMLRRWLAIGGPEQHTPETAAAFGNLGIICMARADLDEAESLFHKALAIDEKLGRDDGLALAYHNLSHIHRAHGDLALAEDMLRKAMKLDRKAGNMASLAYDYADLGLLYWTRRDFDKADKLVRKSLQICERLEETEGVVFAQGYVGLICRDRGDLDKAEEMLLRSLKAEEEMKHPEGIARAHANLGLVYLARGDLDKAEGLLRKSLSINRKHRRREGIASDYADLGTVFSRRGNPVLAEEMLLRSLRINEKLERREAIARVCVSLGMISEDRGDHLAAQDYWMRAHELYEQTGLRKKAAEVSELLVISQSRFSAAA